MQRVGAARRLRNPQSDRVYAIDDHALSCTLRKMKGMPVPPSIDEAELDAILKRAGLSLTPEQVKGILPGAAIFQRLIALVNAPLPREAEPALTFDVEQK
ncbi:hypothetical protein RSO01_20860 [Reyranella soli]|uniref:Uncharacterized protein n=2 Tax=Reyranella soli TaxID=1230389 RepID=A0A512N7F8_9HYPH|nr:hypothetical protein RSO01_20860 [Reyranella soli]